MTRRLAALSISLVLVLIAFPLISVGLTSGPPVFWWLGLAALGLGGLIPPLRRFTKQREPLPDPTRIGLPEDDRVS